MHKWLVILFKMNKYVTSLRFSPLDIKFHAKILYDYVNQISFLNNNVKCDISYIHVGILQTTVLCSNNLWFIFHIFVYFGYKQRGKRNVNVKHWHSMIWFLFLLLLLIVALNYTKLPKTSSVCFLLFYDRKSTVLNHKYYRYAKPMSICHFITKRNIRERFLCNIIALKIIK